MIQSPREYSKKALNDDTMCPNCAITKTGSFSKSFGSAYSPLGHLQTFVRKSSENRQNSSKVAGKIPIVTRRKSDAFDSGKVCRYIEPSCRSPESVTAWKTATLERDGITTTQIGVETATLTRTSANKIVKY